MDKKYFQEICNKHYIDSKYAQFLKGQHFEVFMMYASDKKNTFSKIEKQLKLKPYRASCIFDTAIRKIRAYEWYAKMMGVDQYIKELNLP